MICDRSINAIIALVVSATINSVGDNIFERDIVRDFAAQRSRAFTKSVNTCMTPPVVNYADEVLLVDALVTMVTTRFGHKTEVQTRIPFGSVDIGILVVHRIDELEQETSGLRVYIATV